MHSKVEESLSTMGGIASRINDDVSLQRQKDKVAFFLSSFFVHICFGGDVSVL